LLFSQHSLDVSQLQRQLWLPARAQVAGGLVEQLDRANDLLCLQPRGLRGHRGALLVRNIQQLVAADFDEHQLAQMIGDLPGKLPRVCAAVQRSVDRIESARGIAIGQAFGHGGNDLDRPRAERGLRLGHGDRIARSRQLIEERFRVAHRAGRLPRDEGQCIRLGVQTFVGDDLLQTLRDLSQCQAAKVIPLAAETIVGNFCGSVVGDKDGVRRRLFERFQ
jgi:hypothetical protein